MLRVAAIETIKSPTPSRAPAAGPCDREPTRRARPPARRATPTGISFPATRISFKFLLPMGRHVHRRLTGLDHVGGGGGAAGAAGDVTGGPEGEAPLLEAEEVRDLHVWVGGWVGGWVVVCVCVWLYVRISVRACECVCLCVR